MSLALVALTMTSAAAEAVPLASGSWTVQDELHRDNPKLGTGFFYRRDGNTYRPVQANAKNVGTPSRDASVIATFDNDSGIFTIKGSGWDSRLNRFLDFDLTYSEIVRSDENKNRIGFLDTGVIGTYDGQAIQGNRSSSLNRALVIEYDPNDNFNLTLVDGWLRRVSSGKTVSVGDVHFTATRDSDPEPPPPPPAASEPAGIALLGLAGVALALRRRRKA